MRIHHLLAPWLRTQPDAPAVRDAQIALSYAALERASQAAARQLGAMGVRAGDRVLIVGENCVASAVFVLALSRLDAWSIVANARLSEREIDGIVDHSAARRMLYTVHVSEPAACHARRHGASALAWEGIGTIAVGAQREGAVAEPCHADPAQQVAALIYTSGTSGEPKGVMLMHANLLFAAQTTRELRGLRPGDLVYGALPMAHVVGLSTQFLGCMAGGAALRLEPRFTPADAARALREEGITAFTGVPAMFARLLEGSRGEGRALETPRLRFIGVAGSPLTPQLKADVETALRLPLHNGYGLTETAPTVAQTRLDAPRTDCSVGLPVPGVRTRIVDAQGDEVAADEIGELWVRGPNVMRGYYRNAALTASVLDAQGWFNTGDLARQGRDGALFIEGRTKELIIRSGFNVYPLEVEQVLNAHPRIVQSAVVGRTAGHNEEVIAFVETVEGQTLDEAQLRGYLRERLSPYKVPAQIRVMHALPAAPSGKILKSALKRLAQQAGDDAGHLPAD